MSAALRTCRRTGCRWPADASLSFRYDTREVWLEGLLEEADPAAYDLCPHHAEALTVPRGWDLTDSRSVPCPPREPAGRDLPGAGPSEQGHPPPVREPHPPSGRTSHGEAVGGHERRAGRNRYAALRAALPRLAAEHGTGAEAEGDLPEVEGQLAMPVPGDQPPRHS